jgi:hypothetical protein
VRRTSGEGSFTGDPGRLLRKAPDTGISLHRGPFMSEGTPYGGPGGRAPLLGTPNYTLRTALEWACFHWGPAFGEHGGTLFS